MIDINTLVMSEAVVSFSIWVMFIFYRQTQKTYDGFSYWQAGSLILFVAYVSMSARGIPAVKSSSLLSFVFFFLQNFLLIFAIVVRLDGTFRFVRGKKLWKSFYLLPVITLTMMSYYLIFSDMIELRNLIFSIAMVFVFIFTAAVFLSKGSKTNKLYFSVALINIAWGLLIMVRSAFWLIMPQYSMLDPVFFNIILFFVTPFFNIVLGISLLLVNSQRMQDELKEGEDKFEIAFRSAPYALTLTDFIDGRILDVNEGFEQITGFSRDNVIGKTTLELKLWVNEDDRAKVLNELSANKSIRGKEFLFHKESGETITGLFSAEVITINNHTNILSSIADITELKRAEEEQKKFEIQLHHAQKLESIGILAGGIAHDFNNVLMVILGNSELALKDISEASPSRQRLENINKASLRAAEICRQMLAYSGKGLFVIKPVNLSEMVREMADMLNVSISKKVVLKYNLAEELPSIEVDLAQIQQIIMNLVINASEAIGDKNGIINLSTGIQECDSRFLIENKMQDDISAGHYVYLEVEDTGCGMDHETLSKIFDPFFSTKFIGRGLGLSAVQGIVKSHRGGLKILTKPGKGTIFKVLLPIPATSADLVFEEKRKQEDFWKASGTVLLVDDEEPIRSLGQQILEDMGFDVILAADGKEALKVFNMHRDEIVCVILDLTMPNMGGDEAYHEMLLLKPDISVIISSGFNEQDVLRRFPEKGLSGFIQKPYRIDDLAGMLKQIITDKHKAEL
jgi:two-component system, cell cycle sensor histidine kinase and response regulator CckA